MNRAGAPSSLFRNAWDLDLATGTGEKGTWQGLCRWRQSQGWRRASSIGLGAQGWARPSPARLPCGPAWPLRCPPLPPKVDFAPPPSAVAVGGLQLPSPLCSP